MKIISTIKESICSTAVIAKSILYISRVYYIYLGIIAKIFTLKLSVILSERLNKETYAKD